MNLSRLPFLRHSVQSIVSTVRSAFRPNGDSLPVHLPLTQMGLPWPLYEKGHLWFSYIAIE